ncbi:MAG: oligosaccharide flippase family protein [Clostridiales bacterium]|nr:oligosaccharide flippase family protein [Clostridiales bacterium]
MRKLFKAFATVTIISVATRLMSFVFKIYLSRKLGAEILGLYQICMSVFMLFACICSAGLPVTLSRITAESDTVGNNKRQFGAVSTCLLAGVLISLTIISIILIFPQILDFVFADERCRKIFIIMLPMLLTTCIYAILRGWFWGKKYFGIFSITELIDEILKILFAIILLESAVFAIQKEYAYAIAMLAGDLIVIVVIIVSYFAKKGKISKPTQAREIAKSATPLTVTRIFGSLMSTFISLILPALLVSKFNLTQSEATAEFGRASGMVMPLIFTPTSIIGSLGVVLIPEIASVNAGKGVKSLSSSLGGAITFACLIACYFFTIFSGSGLQLGAVLYDDTVSGEYLSFAAIIMIPMCINNLVVSMLNSMGKETNTFFSHISSCVILIILVLTTPSLLGVKTYFVALGAFHTLSMTINLIMLNKYVGIESKTLFKCGLCLIFSLGIALVNKLAVRALSSYSHMLVIVIVGLITTVAFIPFILLTKTVKVNFKKLALKNRTTFL